MGVAGQRKRKVTLFTRKGASGINVEEAHVPRSTSPLWSTTLTSGPWAPGSLGLSPRTLTFTEGLVPRGPEAGSPETANPLKTNFTFDSLT